MITIAIRCFPQQTRVLKITDTGYELQRVKNLISDMKEDIENTNN
jgi:hypothetical protein